jgi:endonuclease/exonuclease/phosphatase family metal-dependent hydrolase
MVLRLAAILAVACSALFVAVPAYPETFRVATYNLEGYLDAPVKGRVMKTPEARAKVRECICALHPEVLALQEMGGVSALEELRASLKADGLDYPYAEHVSGFDTNIHVAILSRFPFTARRPHTNDNFLLSGRRFRVSRGFGEVDIRVNSQYCFTLITAHLKSKRVAAQADETELRLEEAKLLREKIDACLTANPEANLIVLGDFNDSRDAPSTRVILGKGRQQLVDTRPAERNGDDAPGGKSPRELRNVTWTHFYAAEDTYSRIDFILLSRGMAREWLPAETYVLTLPNWGLASDHRPIVATFEASDK